MQLKLSIVFAACSLLFLAENCLAWSENPEGSDYSSSQVFYDDNYNDNYSNSGMVQQEFYEEPRENSRQRVYSYNNGTEDELYHKPRHVSGYKSYSSRLPSQIAAGEKTIVVDPRVHAWGAYSANGKLIRSGIATSGKSWCSDIGRPCRTKSGTFRIYSLGDRDCYSRKFPIGEGGAPMPYCMYFNGGQALHGSYEVVDGNRSHGCVRLHVQDAQWIRFNFANIGTKVIVRSY
jgi:lipoprotein-anchoring transpeptidase ErfK/SrfK